MPRLLTDVEVIDWSPMISGLDINDDQKYTGENLSLNQFCLPFASQLYGGSQYKDQWSTEECLRYLQWQTNGPRSLVYSLQMTHYSSSTVREIRLKY